MSRRRDIPAAVSELTVPQLCTRRYILLPNDPEAAGRFAVQARR